MGPGPGFQGPSGLHSISVTFFKAGVEEGERESNLHVVDPQILVVIIHLTQNLQEQMNALRVRTRTPVYELGFTSTPIRPDCLTYNIFLQPPIAVTPAA